MGFINLGRLNIQKRNSRASTLISLSDVQPPSVYKSHILNGLIKRLYLSYGITIIQWIMLCHKNHMTTHVITLKRIHVKSLTMSLSTMLFLIEMMFILKAIKSNLKGHYEKQRLTQAVISCEIYETCQRLVS